MRNATFPNILVASCMALCTVNIICGKNQRKQSISQKVVSSALNECYCCNCVVIVTLVSRGRRDLILRPCPNERNKRTGPTK